MTPSRLPPEARKATERHVKELEKLTDAAAELGVPTPSDEMMERTAAIRRIGEEFREHGDKEKK